MPLWDFAWVADPSAWAGLGTLILLEIVLGIDNLVFISILASTLPKSERRHAFLVGLGLALLTRLVLLSVMAWVVSLTQPVVHLFGHGFSWRDFILMGGGTFLLFKGTMEMHDRLEGSPIDTQKNTTKAAFWQVIAQIVILDAIFSMDSVITSVGMVKHLPIMFLAVIAAVGFMLMASGPLVAFVARHPTIIILCLGFLLMIGVSLILDGMGFDIPKGYLYTAIIFSLLIEFCNQYALRNRRRRVSMRNMREATARVILSMLGGGSPDSAPMEAVALASSGATAFAPEEREMVGLYLSAHPLDDYKIIIDHMCKTQLSELENLDALKGQEIAVAGMVVGVQNLMTKTGKPWGKFKLEDYNGGHEFALFGKDYENFRKYLFPDYFLFVRGRVQAKPYNDKELEFKIISMVQLQEMRDTIKEMIVQLPIEEVTEAFIHDLTERVRESKGDTLLRLNVYDRGAQVSLRLFSKSHKVSLSQSLVGYLDDNSIHYSIA